LELLEKIANHLWVIHKVDLVHSDLHGGNIVLCHKKGDDAQSSEPFVCDLGLSKSVDLSSTSSDSNSVVQGVLAYIAPEVFHTRKFTRESDIYAFGMIMHLIADGKQPFRNNLFDKHLARDICNGLRPIAPESAPEPYKKLAKQCCDANPEARPTVERLQAYINSLIQELNGDESGDDVWNTIHSNENIEPLLRDEKEDKYSSKVLPTNDLPKPRNS